MGKNRPIGFLIRSNIWFTSVTSDVSRSFLNVLPNHAVAGRYSRTRIPAGPCINRTPEGSINCHDSCVWSSGIRAAYAAATSSSLLSKANRS